jgi:microcystin-dependent protein
MSDQYLGEIRMFGGTFAPYGWAMCAGQLLAISQNAALFSILGTTYGGNGTTTFGLPDLRGRAPVSQGQGPGLSTYTLGEVIGKENNQLTVSQMPAHTHLVKCDNNSADTTLYDPTNGYVSAQASPASGGNGLPLFSASKGSTTMAQTTIHTSGGNQPFEILQPLLCVTFIIALQGIFPSRN